jgi:hypothetical protein
MEKYKNVTLNIMALNKPVKARRAGALGKRKVSDTVQWVLCSRLTSL